MKNFKILMLNLGYCTSLKGSYPDYLFKSYRHIYLSKKIQNQAVRKFSNLLEKEDPDMVCLQEVKKGQQILKLVNNSYEYADIDIKYGPKSILRKFSLFQANSNAILAKRKFEFRKHYLKNGTKRLLYEIVLPGGVKLIMGHFSLKKGTRKKQFNEINYTFRNEKKKIICGDFNVHNGLWELENLQKEGKLRLVHNEPTFPAFKPKKFLDLALCSRNLKVNAKILQNQISDHLPVVLNLECKAV